MPFELQADPALPEWIAPFGGLEADRWSESDVPHASSGWERYVGLLLPDHFPSYAIALHSFWFHPYLNARPQPEFLAELEKIDESDYLRISWPAFFALKNEPFDFPRAYLSNAHHYDRFASLLTDLWPQEGRMDHIHLLSLGFLGHQHFGNQPTEIFYDWLRIGHFDSQQSERFVGPLLELPGFLKKLDRELSPTLIYSSAAHWAVATDTDLPFSVIGGDRKFIRDLTLAHPEEIFEFG